VRVDIGVFLDHQSHCPNVAEPLQGEAELRLEEPCGERQIRATLNHERRTTNPVTISHRINRQESAFMWRESFQSGSECKSKFFLPV
jgi:hypothetical protein